MADIEEGTSSNGGDGVDDDRQSGDRRNDDRRSRDCQSDGGLPPLDRYFDALSDQRRRYALYYLQRRESASVEELARHIVARETGRSADDLPADEYEPVQSQLHHKHLPRLADYGLVEFDPRTGAVSFGESPRAFETLLWLSNLVEGEQ